VLGIGITIELAIEFDLERSRDSSIIVYFISSLSSRIEALEVIDSFDDIS